MLCVEDSSSLMKLVCKKMDEEIFLHANPRRLQSRQNHKPIYEQARERQTQSADRRIVVSSVLLTF